ncbi:MAG: hypothetical protein VB086_04135 [Clostridiaceae bacterium]|nr:hypothetical protein [Clostridiaceae bacterium]
MFGVLTVTETQLSFWPRLLLRFFPSRGLVLSLHSYRMSSFRVAAVTLPFGLRTAAAEKRVFCALRELRATGVRRLVVPERWQEQARALGFAPVDEHPLLRACAADAVIAGCKKAALDPARVCITVCAEAVDRLLSDQLLTLARNVRTLRLRCPQDLPVLRRRLLDACGIAAEGPLPEGAPEAALVLDGIPPESAALAVDLTGVSHASWPVRALLPSLHPPEEALRHCPENADKQCFLCALYLCGGLTAHEIGLDITEPTQYNNEEN